MTATSSARKDTADAGVRAELTQLNIDILEHLAAIDAANAALDQLLEDAFAPNLVGQEQRAKVGRIHQFVLHHRDELADGTIRLGVQHD